MTTPRGRRPCSGPQGTTSSRRSWGPGRRCPRRCARCTPPHASRCGGSRRCACSTGTGRGRSCAPARRSSWPSGWWAASWATRRSAACACCRCRRATGRTARRRDLAAMDGRGATGRPLCGAATARAPHSCAATGFGPAVAPPSWGLQRSARGRRPSWGTTKIRWSASPPRWRTTMRWRPPPEQGTRCRCAGRCCRACTTAGARRGGRGGTCARSSRTG
mmetsp:Transcript_9596/g.29661  ORF Transcript_9596/g.29661 Transcript_9596/m.29661 type:complete len:219 (-) Transcript_9596:111-767(-)